MHQQAGVEETPSDLQYLVCRLLSPAINHRALADLLYPVLLGGGSAPAALASRPHTAARQGVFTAESQEAEGNSS